MLTPEAEYAPAFMMKLRNHVHHKKTSMFKCLYKNKPFSKGNFESGQEKDRKTKQASPRHVSFSRE